MRPRPAAGSAHGSLDIRPGRDSNRGATRVAGRDSPSARCPRLRLAAGSDRAARAGRLERRADAARLARPRRRGEQPHGADVGAAQGDRAGSGRDSAASRLPVHGRPGRTLGQRTAAARQPARSDEPPARSRSGARRPRGAAARGAAAHADRRRRHRQVAPRARGRGCRGESLSRWGLADRTRRGRRRRCRRPRRRGGDGHRAAARRIDRGGGRRGAFATPVADRARQLRAPRRGRSGAGAHADHALRAGDDSRDQPRGADGRRRADLSGRGAQRRRWRRFAGGRVVRRTRAGRGRRVQGRGARRGDHRDLPPARRRAAGDRARGGAGALDEPGADPRSPRSTLRVAHPRLARRAGATPDTAPRGGVVLRRMALTLSPTHGRSVELACVREAWAS